MSGKDHSSGRSSGKPLATAEPAGPQATGRLLGLVGDLVEELHPGRSGRVQLGLDSQLDRDLGFDSLGRVELLYRLERAFGVSLPEALLGEAETPGDLLIAILSAEGREKPALDMKSTLGVLGAVEAAPRQAATLPEVLDWHVQAHPERPHLQLLTESGQEETLTYTELSVRARSVAAGLRERGLAPAERVAIMLPTGAAFFAAFFGILYAGGVPVPIYPPMRRSQIEEHLRRQAKILQNAGASFLIVGAEAHPVAVLLRSQVTALQAIATVEELTLSTSVKLPEAASSLATALIQYTSGSTGDPKGVVLSHQNLLSNIRAMGDQMEASSSDVFVSWLPLYHDMGLIGAWLGSLYYAAPAVIMSPISFLARPERWLWAIHRHRGTLSAAPNFAFELCLHRIDAASIEGLDLGSLRFVANGAEPINPDTIRRFTDRFADYGFRREAMKPVYGLAESAVGLAFPPSTRAPVIDQIERSALSVNGLAVPTTADDATKIEFVACGRPLPGHEIRIVDATGQELGERRQGRLHFRGPSATKGYFQNESKNRELFVEDWLDSGDLAYEAGGDVFITGRIKDVILRAGRNIYPQEVEEAVGEVEGLRKGCTAVFGSPDPTSGTERVVILAETRATDLEIMADLRRRVSEVTLDILENPPDEVVLVPPRTVPKTSSGKVRRAAARALYEEGRLGVKSTPLWWQVVRLILAGLRPQARRGLNVLASLFYAGYWWGVIFLLGGLVWPLALVLPGEGMRWTLLHYAARLAFRLLAIPVEIRGGEGLPHGGCVVVANHASYIDGLILAASVSGPLAFVAKRELAAQRVAGPFLRRLGTVFVERFDREASVQELDSVLAAARAGKRLVFFAEGTFTRAPGLLPFRLGAFIASCQAKLPVVPIALQGTRSVMRSNYWFPRRGQVKVTIGEPIRPDGEDFNAALRLRDKVRHKILAHCGEPDLER
ncbi:AMP-binding protein [Pelagibius litoralis]|uniref:AMP-binding protein n=1 Tax=Pelagibius litoralis TaxID=374515 RepID=UPI00197EE7DD|nr:AMP-binding protein [Pelagibius litoralis]